MNGDAEPKNIKKVLLGSGSGEDSKILILLAPSHTDALVQALIAMAAAYFTVMQYRLMARIRRKSCAVRLDRLRLLSFASSGFVRIVPYIRPIIEIHGIDIRFQHRTSPGTGAINRQASSYCQ